MQEDDCKPDYAYSLGQQMQEISTGGMYASIKKPTTRQRLVLLRESLSAKLEEINKAIAALDSNPEFERVHNLIQRAL